MKSSPLSSGEQLAHLTAPTDKKRKRSLQQLPSNTIRGAPTDENHINRFFPGKPLKSTNIEQEHQSSPKRSKTQNTAASPPHPGSVPLTPEKMYTFTSRQPTGAVVDLTNSPPRNATPRRLSGMKPVTAMNPHQGARKLVVKNLKKESAWDPEKYLDQVWTQLDTALTKIFAGNATDFSMEDLYRGVENVCKQGRAKTVYERLHQKCLSHLKNNVLPGLQEKSSQDNVTTLGAVLAAWSSWTSQVTTIRCIFYYMDRSYLLQHSKTTLNDVCIQLFRDTVFSDTSLKSQIVDGACDLVSADRTHSDMNQSLLKQAISMFHDLATYTNSFEPRLLAISQKFIVTWADETSADHGVSDYVTASNQLITKELERCDVFSLDTSTRRDLLALLEDHLVERKLDYLSAQEDLAQLLDKNAVTDLGELYTLLQRRRLGERLKKPFTKWVDATGTSIIFDDKASEDMVVRLLSLKRRLDNTWRTSFQRDGELGHGLREAFETFINKTKKGESTWGTDNSKTGEMIAKYVDMLLKGGSKAIPTELTVGKTEAGNDQEEDEDRAVDEDMEINNQLDQVLDLFRFVHGKAVFEAFYKKDLAKRLLMGRSASADAERSMLSRLKTECGAGFTQNLEQMFRDIELGREEMSSYKNRLDEMQKKPGEIDMNVNVLSSAAWPTYPDVPVRIPAEVNTAIEEFEAHYKSKHSGRKLTWKHALASCQMKASFPKGPKEFVVSAYQAIILLLFNGLAKDDHLTYEFIKTESGLPEVEVKRTLQSLACAKLRPIKKEPQGKDIGQDDKFTVNQAFSHPKYRVRINQVQLKETKQENKETHERVAEDRNFECQAAIVRIMKSRKTIGHSELVAEVIKATRSRGVLGVADIKKNIDRLIEKDYMEREEGNTYSYVA